MSRFNVAAALAASALREASTCPACGKPRVVMNTEFRHRQPERLEAVTPDSHCQCERGLDQSGPSGLAGYHVTAGPK